VSDLERAIAGLAQFDRRCPPNISLMGHFGSRLVIFLGFLRFSKTLCDLKFHRIDNIKQRGFYECLRHGQIKMAARGQRPRFYIIVMSKQKRKFLSFGRENKREEHRPQTETSRTNNVDKDKLSDTDEREPLAEPKAKAARRNFQSTWLEKFKWLTLDPTD